MTLERRLKHHPESSLHWYHCLVPDPIMPGLVKPIKYVDLSDVNPCLNLINSTDDHSIANVFCFGAFAIKITGVVYNNCTSNFPFMLLHGNICFFVMYH